MDEFYNDSKIDMSRSDPASGAAGKKCQKRAKTFASAAYRIENVTFDCRIKSGRLSRNPRLYFLEMRLDQLRQASERAGGRRRRRNNGSLRARACEKFHTRRIVGRLTGCQNNTCVNFPGSTPKTLEGSPRQLAEDHSTLTQPCVGSVLLLR